MMTRIVTILLAALTILPVVGCDDSDPEPVEDATSTTGELVDTSSDSGDVVGDSSSSSSEESTGDEVSGSTSGSESSTGETEPDPQPEDGMLSSCDEQAALSCQSSLQCLIYDDWQAGFCTDSCHTVETCAANDIPKSSATLACAPLSSLSYKFCVLACDDDNQCPVGMECALLPYIPADEPIQRVCV